MERRSWADFECHIQEKGLLSISALHAKKRDLLRVFPAIGSALRASYAYELAARNKRMSVVAMAPNRIGEYSQLRTSHAAFFVLSASIAATQQTSAETCQKSA